MKSFILSIALCLGFASVAPAFAQSTSTTNASTTATTQASNMGNALTNNFVSPGTTDENVHYSGVTGANTAVGLGSFSSSFSSDYCGGVAQAGVSAPYITIVAGHPVLGDPGNACVDTRAAVHTMEFSVTYGSAAKAATAAGNTAAAKAFADMSGKLAAASVNMLCNLSPDVRKAYRDAGVACPLTDDEKKALDKQTAQATTQGPMTAQQQASVTFEPTDPFVRARMGLPAVK